MNFEEILDQAIAMLQRRGRVTYRTLKWQFQLDDDALVGLCTKNRVIKVTPQSVRPIRPQNGLENRPARSH